MDPSGAPNDRVGADVKTAKGSSSEGAGVLVVGLVPNLDIDRPNDMVSACRDSGAWLILGRS
jgi:hypothetical protein